MPRVGDGRASGVPAGRRVRAHDLGHPDPAGAPIAAILDTHVHFWDPAARTHDWLAAHPALQRRFGPDDLDAGRHDLAGVVFVEADCRDEEALDEVRWVSELAVRHPLVRGIVAYAPLHRGSAVAPHLAGLAANPLVVGVRWLLQGRSREMLAARGLVEGVRLLPGSGLTFDLCATHDQLPAVAALVEACPDTSFVLDHLGKPPIRSGRIATWRSDLARLASFSNVACKLSGLSTEASASWELEVQPYLNYALEVFGPSRCMIGSDWPVAGVRTTAERWFDVVLEIVAGLPSPDRDAVLRSNGTAIYGLSLPAPASAPVPAA